MKLQKTSLVSTLASVRNTDYVLLADGTVARRLKPVVVRNNHYYNMVIDGRLRRFTAKKILTKAQKLWKTK